MKLSRWRISRKSGAIVAAVLLLVQAGLLAWTAWRNSPVTDEPGQLSAGISHWELGRFELYRVTPPLVRSVGAVAALLAGPTTDWSAFHAGPGTRADHAVGRDFAEVNGPRIFWLTTVARWACIPFALLGGAICFRWARELYGEASGLLALALWCFSPDVLGHGHLLTTDVAGASFSVATFYSFWRWLRGRTWADAILAGCFLGGALLTKATYVIDFGLMLILWLVWRLRQKSSRSAAGFGWDIGQIAAIFAVALFLVNAAYGFDGSFKRLKDYIFVSEALAGHGVDHVVGGNRFSESWFGTVPVPLPEQYVLGVDYQKIYFERGLRSYLRGEWKTGGWWYYYLYGLAVKVPLGTWLLVFLGAATTAWGLTRGKFVDDLLLLAPALAVLVLVSSQTGFNKNLRYVMAVYPFAFVWVSRVVSEDVLRAGRGVVPAALVAAGWSVASSLSVYPHSLSYFNEAVGGPERGHEHLIHTNIDFGQDLLYLRDWLQEHPTPGPLFVTYYGKVDPRSAGIKYSLPMRDDGRWPPGRYAISVNILRGHGWTVPDGNGARVAIHDDYSSFLTRKPVGRAGYSIYIYDVAGGEG
ncbi:MAG: glycosyltransferase family 39 protein [Planctomycetota bacterium]|nr:glycosyltransferase family 39 protein [Planctomycetota bacterium]